MRAPRLRWLIPVAAFVAVVLVPLVAWGQTPAPGEEPEVVRPWTWWLAIPIALGAVGLVALIALRYVRVSSRFFGKEEPPVIPERPRAYAGVNAPAYPAPAPAPAPAAQQAATPAPAPARPEPAQEEPEPAQEEPEPAQEEPEPAQEQPEPQPAEASAEPAQASEPAGAADGGDDVYERVLKEQLDKGVSPKVAEGRAKAAAHRARRSG